MREAMLPIRPDLPAAVKRGDFWWAAGIEDTFITTPHPRTGRTLDEYELTDHYGRWQQDIDLMGDLGVGAARYGIPWHHLQPAPDAWDWRYADGPIERMLSHGIAPQIDLVHYGLPHWVEGGFLNPDYPRHVAEYAARVAERYRGRVFWYTPLNEPRITAWYCGRIGWWPPFQRSNAGFVKVMLAVCRGICETVRALHAVDPRIVDYHVDATDLFYTNEPTLAGTVGLKQNLVFLALDLVTGAISETHPLYAWLISNGATPAELEAFRREPVRPPIIGLNLYPMFTSKLLVRDANARVRTRMTYADGTLIERLAGMYYDRYRAPLAISETATLGSVRRRLAWLDESVGACRKLRAGGLPMCGYTWWPLFSLVAWAWRQGHAPVGKHLLRMGLWDLDPDPSHHLERRRTAVADRYAAFTPAGSGMAGRLAIASAA